MSLRCTTLLLALTAAGCAHALQSVPSAPLLGGRGPRQSAPLAAQKWYVDGVHGSNKNDCRSPQQACKTIGHAISLSSDGDSIKVAAATYPENLSIHRSLDIAGAGSSTTIVDGRGLASEIINSKPGAALTIRGFTLRNGGGIGDGGGVYNCFATLTIIDSAITGNFVRSGRGTLGFGGGIYNCPGSILTIVNTSISRNRAEAGGAICNGGALTIINSTFSGNMVRKRRGGGIFNYGTLTISNSTFSGNSAPNGTGGGIHNGQLFGSPGTLSISSSTISGNTAGAGASGGIFNLSGGSVTLQNTIVSGNSARNCTGALTSNGYNLSSDGTCSFDSPGDLNNTDPKLGPLRDNGGPTLTRALLAGSPAIDTGNPAGCVDSQGHPLATDQRGEPRPDPEDSAGCDIGAYERQSD